MTSSTTRPAKARRRDAVPATEASPQLLPSARSAPKQRRSLKAIAGGVALILVAALLAWFVFLQTQTQNQVVQVRADLPRGQTITADDLQVVTVGAIPGVSTVAGSQMQSLVGQVALVDLSAGALLPQGAVGATSVPATGKSLVGVVPPAGGAVGVAVRPGSRLRLVVTSPKAASSQDKDPNTGTTFLAVMVAQKQAAAVEGGSTVYTVEVDEAQAPLIAQMAAEGRVAIVKDADR